MSGTVSHSEQVSANLTMARHLHSMGADPQLGTSARQWQMTVFFYVAVHWVESQFDQRGYPESRDHQSRKQRIRQLWPTNRGAINAYLQLEARSRRARYEGWVPSAEDINQAETRLQRVQQELL